METYQLIKKVTGSLNAQSLVDENPVIAPRNVLGGSTGWTGSD
jgi:hypothetical protein